MSNLYKLIQKNVDECYSKMNLVSLNTSRALDETLPSIAWDDFEVGVQLVQEYVFHVISDLDKGMFPDELRHYLYNSKIQRNVATFSLCSPDSLRFLAHSIFGGDYAQIPQHAQLIRSDIRKIGVATDFSIGDRLGVNLDYSSEDWLIDRTYALTSSLKSLINDCNPLRLQYCMSYCSRFVRFIRLFEDYFADLAERTNSVTAIILAISSYWVRRNISYELDDFNALMQATVRSSSYSNLHGDSFKDTVQFELDKFYRSHNLKPTADQIKAEILDWVK